LQVHCVNSDIPVERLGASSGGFYETTYNSGVMFRGAYIGRDIRVMRLTKPILRVHLEVLESLTQVNNSAFKPPPDAVEVERRSLADGSVIAGKLLNKKQPEYPMFAKSQRIQGTVTLGAVIGGTVRFPMLSRWAGRQSYMALPSMPLKGGSTSRIP
jgi:hypothetical protein